MKCHECGKTLRERKPKEYRYRESGLNNVTLTGIRVFECPEGHGEFPEIPNIVGFHQAIARMLAKKPAALTGAEFRFLRKEMGLKAKDLARHLGTTDVNLSRWETGGTPINPAADRLLRLLFALQTVQEGRAVEPAKFVQSALETFARIATTKRARPLEIRIPAEQLLTA